MLNLPSLFICANSYILFIYKTGHPADCRYSRSHWFPIVFYSGLSLRPLPFYSLEKVLCIIKQNKKSSNRCKLSEQRIYITDTVYKQFVIKLLAPTLFILLTSNSNMLVEDWFVREIFNFYKKFFHSQKLIFTK